MTANATLRSNRRLSSLGLSPEHSVDEVACTAAHKARLRHLRLRCLCRRCAWLRSVGCKRQDQLPVVLL
jgi:hypothetical protein